MKFTIELNGLESPEAVTRLHNAINVLYDVAGSLSYMAAVPSPPPVVPAPPVAREVVAAASTAPADDELKAAGFGGGVAANATAAQQADLTAPPAPPAPRAANNFPGLDLDADGLPYDPRIHSSSKVKNKGDNKWKLKRGVDESVVAAVTQELRALLAVPVPSAPAAAAPPPPPVPVAPAAPDAGAVVVPPPPAAAAPPPPPPAAAASADPQNFVQLMGWVGPLSTAGKLSADTISAVLIANGVADANGVGQLTLLMQRPDLIPAVYAGLKQAAGL